MRAVAAIAAAAGIRKPLRQRNIQAAVVDITMKKSMQAAAAAAVITMRKSIQAAAVGTIMRKRIIVPAGAGMAMRRRVWRRSSVPA